MNFKWLGDCSFTGCNMGNIIVSPKSIATVSIERNTSLEESFHSLTEPEILLETSKDADTSIEDSQNVNDLSDGPIYEIEDD